MAQRRLISRSLGCSRKFLALQSEAGKLGEFAQLLFTLLVVSSDDFGRQAGDALTVKLSVLPGSPRREVDFEKSLLAMHKVKLIQLYSDSGNRFIQIVNFRREQPGLKPSLKSRYPDPPADAQPNKPEASKMGSENSKQEVEQNQQLPDTPGDSRKPAEIRPILSESESVSESVSDPSGVKSSSGASNSSFGEVHSFVAAKKRGERSPKKNQKPETSEEALQLARELRDCIRIRDPAAKAARTANLDGWARDIDLLIRIDQRRPNDISSVIAWCHSPGCWWGSIILSGSNLRRKFDTLIAQMKNGSGARRDAHKENVETGKKFLERRYAET